ncbi:MAG TPA: protein-tyrosine-phosphatase [Saprospiraceae bacterium]|nr:protein-tyrosine-phosphatase [Saprospiraceae bacterium]HMQ84634.1 protein-tyrosine-phosphatase [Saprospiraceae bacterium]
MKIDEVTLNGEIERFCKELEGEFGIIPKERKDKLSLLSNYISNKIKEGQTPKIVVICTHNSRRSHIGQIWLAVGAEYYQIPEIQTFSGGTETTAFNIRAVKAFQRIGFNISAREEESENPIYQISWKDGMKPYQAFSKKYEDEPNPKEKFAAVMVCSEADEGCPFVLGCDFRLSLPFDDPKEFDGTELETAKYDERIRQIGREMLFVISRVIV